MSVVSIQASETFAAAARELAELGHNFYTRGWVLGTSGNFSTVLSRDPLRLAITPSGVDKGALTADEILSVNEGGQVLSHHAAKPSDETLLHLMIVARRAAGAVLHTHSVWSTSLSNLHAAAGGVALEGFEMLKGLAGVRTHEHHEWLPIVNNSQDMKALAEDISVTLTQHPNAHGVLLRGHGLYTWGRDLREAKRHVEILEFLLEAFGRMRMMSRAGS
jgi:methylthioribulose-1-phosphate dehydratase